MLLFDHDNIPPILSFEKDEAVNTIFPPDHDFKTIYPNFKNHEWNYEVPKASRFKTHQFLIGFAAALVIGILLWPLLPRYYQAQATLVFRSPEQGGKLALLKQDLDEKAIQSELDILSSPPLTTEVIKRLHLQNDRELATSSPFFPFDFISNARSASSDNAPEQTALTRLNVQHDRRSYTVRFGYLSKDPKKTTDMTSTLATLYLENLSDRKQRLLARDVDVARSRLLSLSFRESQLAASLAELSSLSTSNDGKDLISDLAVEKTRLVQAMDIARAQIEDALSKQQNVEPDAVLIASAAYPTAPLYPQPFIFITALVFMALVSGVGMGMLDINGLRRIIRR